MIKPINIKNQIPENELKAIQQIVLLNGDCDFLELTRILLKVFAENIHPLHYIALGLIISEKEQIKNKQTDFLNYVQLCQRLN